MENGRTTEPEQVQSLFAQSVSGLLTLYHRMRKICKLQFGELHQLHNKFVLWKQSVDIISQSLGFEAAVHKQILQWIRPIIW